VAGTRVTLADIAAQVGVSSKTVSNVVNGTGWVGAEVRARVETAIEELGYRPNLAARHLRSGTSGVLALVLPSLAEPYFAELAAVFVDAAQARGLTVLVAQTGGRREIEIDMLEGVRLPALDGLILSPLALTRADLDARRSRSALVLLGEHGEALAGGDVHHVGVDNVGAAAAATRALLDRGHRRIAVIGVQPEGAQDDTSRLRYAGYRRALDEAGIPVDPALLGHVGDFNRAEGSVAAERLLDAGAAPDALLCFSDSLALGALYTLGVRGVRVPEDVEVMGFDDIAEGRFSVPAFSTVDPGRSGVAERALDLLTGVDRSAPGHHAVPFSVILR
jgi:DNA-binding LacI/PurR family transcriptional regulator